MSRLMSVEKSPTKAPSPDATLRKLFLTLFLRGRSSQGLSAKTVPTSITRRLGLVLLVYGCLGAMAFMLFKSPVFLLSAFLHGFTFLSLGMFIVSSAGETLFDRDEAEILLHRPVTAGSLLWAKVAVLVQVSCYLAFSLNFIGLFVGLAASDGNLLFPLVHLFSTFEEALFCAGCVILSYQLCLKWFGRRRLESMMTTAQVIAMGGFMIGSQLLPRMAINNAMEGSQASAPWWIALLPPGWFASLDDAVAGSHARMSWFLAGVGLMTTSAVLWLALARLAKVYEVGLQELSEASAPSPKETKRLLWIRGLASTQPICWFLRNSVERTSFVLVAAYLARNRETKLRAIPQLTMVVVMPLAMMLSQPHYHSPKFAGQESAVPVFDPTQLMAGFGLCLAGAFLGSASMTVLSVLSFSQEWKASEIFRVAPMQGPWPLQKGAMTAVNVLLVVPMTGLLLVFAVVEHQVLAIPLLLPGLLMVPIYGRLPAMLMGAVPLSRANEEAAAASRGCLTMLAPFFGMVMGGIGMLCRYFGWFSFMLIGEAILVAGFCMLARPKLEGAKWQNSD